MENMSNENNLPDTTKKVGSKEYVEQRVQELTLKRVTTFCPIIRNICAEGCVCYVKPEAVNLNQKGKAYWDCQGGYCNCYSLMGPV